MSSTIWVDTTSGPILGFGDTFALSTKSSFPRVSNSQNGGEPRVFKWLGVPYAKAKRWERPEPPDNWLDPILCTEFGPCFPQTSNLVELIFRDKGGFSERAPSDESEEKGFNLNVFSPMELPVTDLLPVMVWVYGGSLEGGRSASMMYDPTEWIRRESSKGRNFIVVTGNYRCNAFGFMACQDLVDTDPDGLAGNYGAYDCIALLRWVQENIKKFGGDPGNVTLFGESAGGFLIGALLVTQEKLFKHVILQSGFPETLTHRDVGAESNTTYYESLCTQFNISKESSAEERITALRKIPTSKLLAFMFVRGPVINDYGLTIENTFSNKGIWPKPAIELIKQGKWNPHLESVMMGHTKDEGSIFAYFFQTPTKSGYENVLTKRCPFAPRDEIDKLYPSLDCTTEPRKKTEEAIDVSASPATTDWKHCVGSRLISDQLCVSPMENLAVTLGTVKNHQTNRRCKLFIYQLNETMPSVGQELDWGAFHTIDLPLLFNMKMMWTPESPQARTSAVMGKIWADFARTGIPDPNWPEYSPSTAPFKYILDTAGQTRVEDIRGARSEIEQQKICYWIDKLPQLVTFREPPITA